MGLEVGDVIPDFVIKKHDGTDFISKDYVGKQPFVIYFYPKNFTPGCTKEACDFRDSYEDFKVQGVEVIGVSSDSVKSHERFKTKYRLPFIFLADTNNKVRKLFGVKSGLFGVLLGRETYVVDKKGVIQLKFNSINASSHLRKASKAISEMIKEK
ncbi:peroxiredoxin [Aquimarina addita]|uniref:thioredoxin-dependent peroxiredoxin n=1 Tax=Aquimarina addita TaxID=870485 RepID=A0ABP7XB82_9FLAO